MLVELCNPSVLRPGFIFGLLPGWWLGTEDNRKWGAPLSEKDWHNVLSKNGFSGADLIFRDHQSERMHLDSAIMSTALHETNGHRGSELPVTFIIVDQGSELQSTLATQIQSALLSSGTPSCNVIGLRDVHRTITSRACFVILPEVEAPLLAGLDSDQFASLQKLITSAGTIIWVTKGGGTSAETPDLDLVTGFARCVRSEYSKLSFVTVALESNRDVSKSVEAISEIFKRTMISERPPVEQEYIQQNGYLSIGRLVEANYLNRFVYSRTAQPKAEFQMIGQNPHQPLVLEIASPGLLNTIQFVSDVKNDELLLSDEVELKVEATGLNFKDVVVLLGQVASDHIGMECAGIITRLGKDVGSSLTVGDRVLCMAEGAYKTYVRTKAAIVSKISNDMSYVYAAAIPMAYCTAYHSLYELGQLREGMSVLIHCGAGGVGQAAIQLAMLSTSASNIYVTVGTEEKKKLIMSRFSVPESHIFSSRSLSFAHSIKKITGHNGVDLVLNSLTGEKLRRSWDCVAPFGRFIEIGLKDLNSYGALPMLPFSRGVTFSSVNVSLMMRNDPHRLGNILRKVMTLLGEGKIAPQVAHVYDYSQLEEAFRFLQGRRNLGKVVITINETDVVPVGDCPISRPG